jgi:hypothetical protein
MKKTPTTVQVVGVLDQVTVCSRIRLVYFNEKRPRTLREQRQM